MPHISFVENLKLTEKSWKSIAPYISGYLVAFISILLIIEIIGIVGNIMSGFTLFSFLPGWLRFFCFDLIASALIGIPAGIIGGFLISAFDYYFLRNYILKLVHDENYIEYLKKDLKIKCIDCFNAIELDGGVCVSGQTDIRCKKCGALMTITIEEGKIKKLILKKSGIYN